MNVAAIRDCEVSLDTLNYLARRLDGNERIMPLRGITLHKDKKFFAALTCKELDISWGMKNIINLMFDLDRFTLIEDIKKQLDFGKDLQT